jgi:GntR family transcriptional repressor for pyruvate dehydrogenase complex
VAVTDDAIQQLKAMISSGELRPGDRLPREADLARDLGLSRNSLREAVRALSLIRILDVRQGDGTYVSSLASDSLLDALSFIVEFHHDASVLDLLEVRRILEPAASARAAVKISEPALRELAEILQRGSADLPIEELMEADVQFHRAIAAAAGNPVLASLIDSLSGPTQKARIWRGITQEGALQRTLAEHRAIFDAISRRDPELARTWATVHVAGVEDWISRTLT